MAASSKKKRASYVSTVISMTLVLYLLGAFGVVFLQAEKLKNYYREHFQVNVDFRDNAQEADIIRMQKTLEAQPYIRQADFISKEEGKEMMREELGEDFVSVLGYNPLPDRIQLYFRADYATPDSIEVVREHISENVMVREVLYRRGVLENLDRNVRILGTALFGFALILSFISITLIHNAIRLHLFSMRVLIKSMQLVGATQWFIRMPFLKQALWNGLLAATLACLFLSLSLSSLEQNLPFVSILDDSQILVLLAAFLLISGVGISVLSSYRALSRFLRMRLEDLY